MWAGIWALLRSLPEVLALIAALEKMIKEANTERKVKSDLAKIAQAFKDKDAGALNDIFHS